MLNGDVNQRTAKKLIGLISKKQLCTCSTLFCTFLCRCFARLQPTLVASSLSHSLIVAKTFSCFSSEENSFSLFFLFLVLALSVIHVRVDIKI